MDILGIFVKHPVAGQVKTRLAAEIGAERAADLYAAFVVDLVARFRDAGNRRFLCYAPDSAASKNYFSTLAGDNYAVWTQPNSSLGARLAAFFDHTFQSGAERVVVIGSDSPTLPRSFVDDAFVQLRSHDCVLGPACDGGYFLIGQQGCSLPIFNDIPWSTSRVLDQTASRLTDCGASLSLLSPWYDVDSLEDLELLRGHIRAMRLAGISLNLEQTKSCLGWDTLDPHRSV